MASRSDGLIEAHAHVVPLAIMGGAGPYGPEITPKEGGGFSIRTSKAPAFEVAAAAGATGKTLADGADWLDRLSNPIRRLSEMNANGVDAMVVSPGPPFYMYSIESEYGIALARRYNEALAEYCEADSDRLFFLATLPMQSTAAAAAEATEAMAHLGARGVYVGVSDLGGRELDDPALWPLYEALVEADLPLCIHPGPSTFGSGEVDCYNERLASGFPVQETHAIFRLIAGGVLDAFPQLKVYVSHGGGYFPFQIGRIEAFLEIAADAKAQEPIATYLRNLYFDIILHDVRARRLLVEVAGPQQLLYGTNYAGMDSVDGAAFLEGLELSDDDHLQVARQTAISLFKLPNPGADRPPHNHQEP